MLPTFSSAGELPPTDSPSPWEWLPMGICKSIPDSRSTNTRGKVVILLARTEYQIHIYKLDNTLLHKVFILENGQIVAKLERETERGNTNMSLLSFPWSVPTMQMFLVTSVFAQQKRIIAQSHHLTLSNWKIQHILSSATPCLQEKSFNFSTFNLECYLETFSS